MSLHKISSLVIGLGGRHHAGNTPREAPLPLSSLEASCDAALHGCHLGRRTTDGDGASLGVTEGWHRHPHPGVILTQLMDRFPALPNHMTPHVGRHLQEHRHRVLGPGLAHLSAGVLVREEGVTPPAALGTLGASQTGAPFHRLGLVLIKGGFVFPFALLFTNKMPVFGVLRGRSGHYHAGGLGWCRGGTGDCRGVLWWCRGGEGDCRNIDKIWE